MRQADPKLAVSDEQFPSLRPCGQRKIARVAARPTTPDSEGLCNPVDNYIFKKMFQLLHIMIWFRHQNWQTVCSVSVLVIGFVQEVE